MPKVSVIIPVYNVEKYLRECLDSVVNQTLKDLEIILVDDGSTDSSLSICQEYEQIDSRIKVLKQKNQGAGVARNRGLDSASGDYLYFLDSDDFIDLHNLEKMYSQISKTDSDICFCKNNIFNENSNCIENIDYSTNKEVIPNLETFSRKDIPNDILQICVPNLFIKLYKTEFIRKNCLRFQEIKTCNDVYFNNISLLLADKITYVDEDLITYRQNSSTCLSANRGKSSTCVILAYEEVIKYIKSKNIWEEVKETVYKKAIDNFLYELVHCDKAQKIHLQKEIKKKFPIQLYKKFRDELFYHNQYIYVSFIEKLFSVKKMYRKKKLIITILGIKLKFKI